MAEMAEGIGTKSDRGMRSWFYPAKLLARAELTQKHVRVGWITHDEARHVMDMPEGEHPICLMRTTNVFESHMPGAAEAIIDG